MGQEREFFLPNRDAVSVFTDNPDVVNEHWIDENRELMLGVALQKGIETLDALEDFLRSPAFSTDQPQKKRVGDAALRHFGRMLAAKIRLQIKEGFPEDLFPPPRLLTVKGGISMRWIMYMANTEKMTPEEAFIYGAALATKKD